MSRASGPASPFFNPQDPEAEEVLAAAGPGHGHAGSDSKLEVLKPHKEELETKEEKKEEKETKTEHKMDACSAKEQGTGVRGAAQAEVCDACEFCDDICDVNGCVPCALKWKAQQTAAAAAAGKHHSSGKAQAGRFTMCQARRHNKLTDLWLVAHGKVYDATMVVDVHPGGSKSLLRKVGQDCSKDFDFHSRDAQKLWAGFCIGTLVHCDSQGPAPKQCIIS